MKTETELSVEEIAAREVKRVTARFVEPVSVGDMVVNADRETPVVPQFEVTRLSYNSARLRGVDHNLDLELKLYARARRSFRKAPAREGKGD